MASKFRVVRKSRNAVVSMCEVEFEGIEERALLIRQEGKLHALSNKCTHYGAPLVKGCLGNGRIRCPWHGACFNINNGDIEDFPGLDSLQKFEVSIDQSLHTLHSTDQVTEVENGNFGIVRANRKVFPLHFDVITDAVSSYRHSLLLEGLKKCVHLPLVKTIERSSLLEGVRFLHDIVI